MADGWVTPPNNIIVTIVNLLTGTRIEFFSNPEALSDAAAAHWEATAIRGRSSQYHGYDNTGPRTSSLDLPIHEDYLLGGERNIKRFVNKVRALVYPEYRGYVVPPRCMLRVGQSLGGIIIINNVSCTWSRPIRNNRYINGNLTLDFVILQPFAPTATYIEGSAI